MYVCAAQLLSLHGSCLTPHVTHVHAVCMCVCASLSVYKNDSCFGFAWYISMYVCIHTNKQSYIYVHILQNVYPVAQWCRMPNCKLMSYCPSARMYSISNI